MLAATLFCAQYHRRTSKLRTTQEVVKKTLKLHILNFMSGHLFHQQLFLSAQKMSSFLLQQQDLHWEVRDHLHFKKKFEMAAFMLTS